MVYAELVRFGAAKCFRANRRKGVGARSFTNGRGVAATGIGLPAPAGWLTMRNAQSASAKISLSDYMSEQGKKSKARILTIIGIPIARIQIQDNICRFDDYTMLV